MAENKSDFGAFFSGFVIGGLVGAAVALILAPQSGEETRALMREKSIEIKERGEAGWQEAQERARHAADDAKARAAEVAAEVRSKAEEIVREVAETATKKAQGATDGDNAAADA